MVPILGLVLDTKILARFPFLCVLGAAIKPFEKFVSRSRDARTQNQLAIYHRLQFQLPSLPPRSRRSLRRQMKMTYHLEARQMTSCSIDQPGSEQQRALFVSTFSKACMLVSADYVVKPEYVVALA